MYTDFCLHIQTVRLFDTLKEKQNSTDLDSPDFFKCTFSLKIYNESVIKSEIFRTGVMSSGISRNKGWNIFGTLDVFICVACLGLFYTANDSVMCCNLQHHEAKHESIYAFFFRLFTFVVISHCFLVIFTLLVSWDLFPVCHYYSLIRAHVKQFFSWCYFSGLFDFCSKHRCIKFPCFFYLLLNTDTAVIYVFSGPFSFTFLRVFSAHSGNRSNNAHTR